MESKIYHMKKGPDGRFVVDSVEKIAKPKQNRNFMRLENAVRRFANGFAIGSFYINRVKDLLKYHGLDI